jgi:hypothetical protein
MVDIPFQDSTETRSTLRRTSDALHNRASRCVLNYGGSYISKSDRPYADRPSQHLPLAPSHVASPGSVLSQALHHRDLQARAGSRRPLCPALLAYEDRNDIWMVRRELFRILDDNGPLLLRHQPHAASRVDLAAPMPPDG